MLNTAPEPCHAELNLRLRAAKSVVSPETIAELSGILRGRGWVTRREIERLRPQWDERFIRELAHAAGGQIVSGPGTPGYCRLDEVTTPYLRHAGQSLLSQGRAMARRGIGLLRRAKLRDLADA